MGRFSYSATLGAVATLLVILQCAATTHLNRDKICIGTNGRMSVPSNRVHHYRNLRDRYENCTYVDGNLELTWLQEDDIDLSFLQYIREVTGYVLISHVDVKRVVLPKLQIIRGRTLFKLSINDDSFALLVMLSKMNTLEMPALRDILQGNVALYNNYNLCHVQSINWTEIMSDKTANQFFTYNFTQPQRKCHCHEKCEKGCWGEGSDNCQKFSKITCSPQCYGGRCYGPGPRDCCHLYCAGGCSGPTQSDCLACQNFYDDGECKQNCPAMKRYNTITYSWETNPKGKYAYGATCVRECPGHLLKDSGACVRSCPSEKKPVGGECVPCDGPCPKTCKGVNNVHLGNIDSFQGCTVIEGSLVILDHSFDGFLDVYDNFTFGKEYPEMHPSKLEVFSTLKEITGYVSIQASHPEFTDLLFLRNLEVIGGRSTTEYFSSLYIVKTSLRSLNMRSLRLIRSGSVYILENKNLCFADQISWKRLTKGDKSQLLFENNKPKDQCEYGGMVCHEECSDDGCWALGENQCLSCRNVKLGDRCINNCDAPGFYKKNSKMCSYCHPECEGGCTGPDSKHCIRCKNAQDGPYCVTSCPQSKFLSNKQCTSCHENCVGGCDGPANNVGPSGCRSCEKALVNKDKQVEYCLKTNETCPLGYFSDFVVRQETGPLRPMAGKNVCIKCHHKCKNCTAFGIHVSVCHKCATYRSGERCEDECPHNHYADEKQHECLPCSAECSGGCYGPSVSECLGCRNYRIYLEGEPGVNNTKFNCTASCPEAHPYKLFSKDLSDPYCATSTIAMNQNRFPTIMGAILGSIFLGCLILVIFGYALWHRNRTKAAALKMTMTMMPYDDNEPLKPTNIKPNLAKIRIVKEAELRKGSILGYGAFGTVYKGVWVPEGENVKVPVAIKVLREGTGTNANKEILEEACIMATVDHPNLLQLLAICMTTQIMLVTQLMPLGCLLDYVRNNKEKIGSKPLLNWCKQIGRGMSYLEERRLVHRDLAARNVLVQTPNCVKITDFGLAKLLDFEVDEYKAAGGKMPIKWLALECIQHRIFTHKSDVWAFGVTVWEILTYGGRPYEEVPAREVPDLLEKGERLPQPHICTVDVYMLMIRCWMLDAEGRPSFRELNEEFAKMSRDPGRFLCIPGDKLMRLPSYTPQDEKELIRSLSSTLGGDGVLMAAEEYLNPKLDFALPNQTSTSVSEPATPIKKVPPTGSSHFSVSDYIGNNVESPQNRLNVRREQQYAQYGSDHAVRSVSSRYGSDPMRIIDSEMGDDECFESDHMSANDMHMKGGAGPGYGWVGDIRLDLPLDEDDYLMPSQQKPAGPVSLSNPHPYMELTDSRDGRKLSHGEPDDNGGGVSRWAGMDNPEYHMMQNGRRRGPGFQGRSHLSHHSHHPNPQQHLGVPILEPNRLFSTSSTASNGSGQYHHNPPTGQLPHNGTSKRRPSQRTSASDNAHEYYNEVPIMPASPQPRSETTV